MADLKLFKFWQFCFLVMYLYISHLIMHLIIFLQSKTLFIKSLSCCRYFGGCKDTVVKSFIISSKRKWRCIIVRSWRWINVRSWRWINVISWRWINVRTWRQTNFHFQPTINVKPTSGSDVISTKFQPKLPSGMSYWWSDWTWEL